MIIIGGVDGMGFSMQATPEVTAKLPEMLEWTAGEIRKSMGA